MKDNREPGRIWPLSPRHQLVAPWRRSRPAGSAVVAAICKYTQTKEILWRKRGCVAALQVRERAPDPHLDRLYCFSGHITSRVILIYHAQVHHRWLPFKDDKGQNTANYFKEKDVTAQGGSCSHSILGWFSTDFRKMKILSKHLLPQFRVREF